MYSFFPALTSTHMISMLLCSMFSIRDVLLAISLAIVMATPPPCLFCLFLYSHMCPSIIGGWPRSFVSVIQQMLHSYSSMAACRLFIIPVIPFTLVYIIFIFLSSVFLFLFFCSCFGIYF